MRGLLRLSLALLALLLALCASASAASPLRVQLDRQNGRYSVLYRERLLLEGGDTAFRAGGAWYSNSGAAQHSKLDLLGVSDNNGADVLGEFEEVVMRWGAGRDTVIETVVRSYATQSALVFEQRFPTGVEGTQLPDRNLVISAFPSFRRNPDLAFLSYAGDFLRYNKAGLWGSNESVITSGLSAGPTLFFQQDLSFTAMLSPFSEFMAAGQLMHEEQLQLGVIGSVTSLPKNYSVKHILYVGTRGIFHTIQEWGALLRTQYNKPARGYEADESLNWLGYNTDNGAYYYYKTLDGKNYEETMLAVYEDAKQRGIPYTSLLLDSWWYFKGLQGGVKNWTAMPDLFPSGLRALKQKTGWNFVGHNRYWSANTDYARQNGGKYDFIIDPVSHAAMPQDEQFWDDLFRSSKEWGLDVYEQDWLYNEFEAIDKCLTDVTVGQRWLAQMANAASRQDVFLQYCMPWPRHALASVQFPAVTQMRASDDYQPANDQWRMGYATMLLHALGVAPLKDTWWSSTHQPGNPYGDHIIEPAPAIQGAVATLSCGAVTPGDALGKSDIPLILRSCRADGRLLKPDMPLRNTDRMVLAEAYGARVDGPRGVNMQTHTAFGSGASEMRWSILLAGELAAPYDFGVAELQAEAQRSYVVWHWTNATAYANPLALLAPTDSLRLPACATADFHLFYFSPVFSANGWALLGEHKWTAVSKQRVRTLQWDRSSITLSLMGKVGEAVTLHFAHSGALSDTRAATCTMGSMGSAVLRVAVNGGAFGYSCDSEAMLTEAEQQKAKQKADARRRSEPRVALE